MPHLSGVFDQFPDLEKVSSEQLSVWISQKPETHFLNNFLGNRILYPQTVPLTQKEMEIDFAILRAAVRLRPGFVFQPQTNKIIIPKLFAERFLPLQKMVTSIIEGINPKGVHFIYIKDHAKVKMLGTVISPLNPQRLSTDEKTVKFTAGKIVVNLPLNVISTVILQVSESMVTLGNEEYKALGGEIGVIVDLRLGGFG